MINGRTVVLTMIIGIAMWTSVVWGIGIFVKARVDYRASGSCVMQLIKQDYERRDIAVSGPRCWLKDNAVPVTHSDY